MPLHSEYSFYYGQPLPTYLILRSCYSKVDLSEGYPHVADSKCCVYFLNWSENLEEWESLYWECGVGVGVGCLLRLNESMDCQSEF